MKWRLLHRAILSDFKDITTIHYGNPENPAQMTVNALVSLPNPEVLQDALGQLGPNVDFECARLAPGRVGVCHRETRNSRNSDGNSRVTSGR